MSDEADHAAAMSTTERTVAFSDGVLAIVITLLVLDLTTPEVEPGQLFAGLLQQWPTYLAYLTSFLYVAVVWLNHKSAFNRIRLADRGLLWANFAVLFTTGSCHSRPRSSPRRWAAATPGTPGPPWLSTP